MSRPATQGHDTESQWEPGSILLEKYRVERVIGRGGMGTVLAVEHLGLSERRALKVMLPAVVQAPGAKERFLREARVSARLRSEFTARIHDVGTLPGGTPYIEMELLEGADLSDLVKAEGPPGVERTVAWFIQACSALEEAHSIGLVHRDLKPANLFLTRRLDGTDCIKVLDFGIARMVSPALGDLALTSDGAIFGSPLYMAPEQMKSARLADARSDIWSLGVSLFEVLTGRPPFDADDLTGLVLAISSAPAPLPRTLRADIPTRLERSVLRCLEKKPDDRFQSVAELATQLRLSIEARPGMVNDDLPPNHARGACLEGPAAEGERRELVKAPVGVSETDRTSVRPWSLVVLAGIVVALVLALAFSHWSEVAQPDDGRVSAAAAADEVRASRWDRRPTELLQQLRRVNSLLSALEQDDDRASLFALRDELLSHIVRPLVADLEAGWLHRSGRPGFATFAAVRSIRMLGNPELIDPEWGGRNLAVEWLAAEGVSADEALRNEATTVLTGWMRMIQTGKHPPVTVPTPTALRLLQSQPPADLAWSLLVESVSAPGCGPTLREVLAGGNHASPLLDLLADRSEANRQVPCWATLPGRAAVAGCFKDSKLREHLSEMGLGLHVDGDQLRRLALDYEREVGDEWLRFMRGAKFRSNHGPAAARELLAHYATTPTPPERLARAVLENTEVDTGPPLKHVQHPLCATLPDEVRLSDALGTPSVLPERFAALRTIVHGKPSFLERDRSLAQKIGSALSGGGTKAADVEAGFGLGARAIEESYASMARDESFMALVPAIWSPYRFTEESGVSVSDPWWLR